MQSFSIFCFYPKESGFLCQKVNSTEEKKKKLIVLFSGLLKEISDLVPIYNIFSVSLNIGYT